MDAFAMTDNHDRIILCFDGAGWHTSKALNLPDNTQTVQLPPYSPDLNPTEHIWNYIGEKKSLTTTLLIPLMLWKIN